MIFLKLHSEIQSTYTLLRANYLPRIVRLLNTGRKSQKLQSSSLTHISKQEKYSLTSINWGGNSSAVMMLKQCLENVVTMLGICLSDLNGRLMDLGKLSAIGKLQSRRISLSVQHV